MYQNKNDQHKTYIDYNKINKHQYDHKTLLRLYQSSPAMNVIIEPSNGVGGIYLGNIDAAADYTSLRKHNIQAVLTVAARTGIKYNEDIIPYHEIIVCDDHPSQDLLKFFDQIYDFIDKYRKITNVFVHCYAGISRSSTSVIMYLMRKFNWTFEKSFFHCRQKRKVTNPNPGFVKQLLNFERLLIDKRAQHEPQQFIQKQQQTSQFTKKHESALDSKLIQNANNNNNTQKQNQGIKSYLDNTDYKNRMTLYREQQQQQQQQLQQSQTMGKQQRSSSGFEQRQQQQLNQIYKQKQQNGDYYLQTSIRPQQSDLNLHKSMINSNNQMQQQQQKGYQSPNFSYLRSPNYSNNNSQSIQNSQILPPERRTMYQESKIEKQRQQELDRQIQYPLSNPVYQNQQQKMFSPQQQDSVRNNFNQTQSVGKNNYKSDSQSLLYKKYQQIESNTENYKGYNNYNNNKNIYTTTAGAAYGSRNPQTNTFLNHQQYNAHNSVPNQKPNTSGGFSQYQQQQYGYNKNINNNSNQDQRSQGNLRSHTPVGYQPATSNFGSNLYSQKNPSYKKYY